nr:retrovirus-related Pol polyprotein from transposon TNT 1-94 [Tanacetum cinerariifolium]
MDVKSAFLNGFINEEVYVAQPSRFNDFEKPDHVYKLKKALYGLKQAPKAWYDRLKAFLIKHEYKMGMVDNTLFTKKKSSNLIIVQIYVDDIIFGSNCQDMCDEFTKIMHDEFEMSMMGELNFFLGLQIKQMKDDIFFNQSKYIKEMLKKFGLEYSKPMKTPMSSDTKLTKDEECESVYSTKYRGMIGTLLYLTASRPDSMFSVCLCARFKEAPKTSHLEAVKRIFRYIKGTMHLGLWYPKRTDIKTIVYADSDHAGDYVDRKSISGICTFVRCCLTSWFSKKQTALAISTTKAEYVSAGKACQQALWMKQALIDYDVRLDDVPIMCDNKGVIDLSKNPMQHSRTKHIEIRHHFLHDNVQKGHISIEKVPNGAHYGYNYPSKVPIISNLEQCYNQNVDEFPQTLPSFHPTCYSGDENSFTYDSNLNLWMILLTHLHNPRRILMRKFNHYSFFETPKVLFLAWDRGFKIKDAFGNKQYKPEHIQELFRKLFNDVQNIHEELAKYINTPSWNRPIVYYDDDDDDDDEDYTIEITPVLPTDEPKDSLIVRDEHLDTIPKKESNKFINLVFFKSIPSGIDEADFDLEGDISLIERLLYAKNYIESFSPSPIPIEDSDSFREEIHLFLTPDDSMPPGIENDDYDFEGDILILEELLRNDSPSLSENESFHFDVPSSPRPPAKPLDDDGIFFDDEPDTGLLTAKVVGEISKRYVHVPNVLPTQPTLCPVIDTLLPFSSENEDKVHL